MSDKTVIITGAGPAGLAAAAEVRRSGLKVRLFEMADHVKGKTAFYCCKADDACSHCSVCHVDRLARAVLDDPGVIIHMNTPVAAVEKSGSGFLVTAEHPGGDRERFLGDYLVLATGFTLFDPVNKPPFGYGRHPDVLSGFELERILLEQDLPVRKSDGGPVTRVGFIQCVGSRDRSLNASHCSQVCCPYAVRLAELLHHRAPTMTTKIFYMDLQSPSRAFDRMIKAESFPVELVNARPAEVLPAEGGGLEVRYEDPVSRGQILEVFDLVVLSAGIHPLHLDAAISAPLQLKTGPDGFYIQPEFEGLALAGTATGPMNITASIVHARGVVQQLLSRSGDA